MSVRRKPEKAVPLLLDQLSKVENHVRKKLANDDDGNNRTREMAPKFEGLESKLKLTSKSMSRIRNWDKKVVEKLCALEQALDDARHKPPSQVPEILARIDEDVEKLKSFIWKVDESVMLANGERPSDSKQQEAADEVAPRATVSEEWAGLEAEDWIVKSETTRSLWASIHWPDGAGDELLRMCLLCLSAFPEDAVINQRPIIYWWMGEGVVSNEEEGERAFQRLLQQGFITNNLQGFSLCPWVRRVVIQLAQELRFFNFSPLKRGGRPGNGERRAFLWEGGSAPTDDQHANVLTVFNMDEQYLEGTKLEWLRELHRLEVLQMGRWQDSPTHHIEAVGKYEQLLDAALASKKHLRYLSLRGISGIETLPAAAIRKLVSLRILDLKACHNLERLPHTVSELRNLTHLDVSECYLLESMPKGLHHLLNLQVLKGFVVGTPGRGSCKIADLVGLLRLRKLSIMVRRQGGKQLGSLKDLSALRILAIFWMGDADDKAPVQLPTSLTRLDLLSVPFKELPEWLHPIMLPNLEKLRIRGGELRELPVNNNHEYEYPKIKSLRLQCLAHLPIQQHELVALFPNYLYLEKTNCHKDQDHPDIIIPPEAP